MQSKTSFFSLGIFKKNITRFWPIWLSYLFLCLYRLPVRLYLALSETCPDTIEESVFFASQLKDTVLSALVPFWFFVFACLCAVFLFSYLYQARSAYMIHALPVNRVNLYITNISSGLLFLLVPQFLSFLASIYVCFLKGMTQLEYLLHWLLLSGGMAFFAFILAVLAVMLTGNTIMAPIFYYAINIVVDTVIMAVYGVLGLFSYGVIDDSANRISFFSPLNKLNSLFSDTSYYSYGSVDTKIFSLSESYRCIGCYVLVAIPLLILCLFLYKKRHLEVAGDVVSFPFLKPLFRWILTFVVSMYAAVITASSMQTKTYASFPLFLGVMALCIFLIFFVSEMLLEKKFLVFHKRLFAECGAMIFLCVLLAFGVKQDVFGLEKAIPDQADISAIYVYADYPITVQESDYETVLAIHRDLINAKDEAKQYFSKYSLYENSYLNFQIRYELKDGTSISRSYNIPEEAYYIKNDTFPYRAISTLSQSSVYQLCYNFTNSYETISSLYGSIETYIDEAPYSRSLALNAAQCDEIREAFYQDVEEGNYSNNNSYRTFLAENATSDDSADSKTDDSAADEIDDSANSEGEDFDLSFSVYLTFQVTEDTACPAYFGEANFDSGDESTASLFIDSSCVHTLEAMRAIGALTSDNELIQNW